MATHSSNLAWKIPWTEGPGGLQSMGSLGVRQDWATSLSCIGEGNGNPHKCSCLENPRDGGAWWAAVYGVAQSRTRLKRLSSNSSNLAVAINKGPTLLIYYPCYFNSAVASGEMIISCSFFPLLTVWLNIVLSSFPLVAIPHDSRGRMEMSLTQDDIKAKIIQ